MRSFIVATYNVEWFFSHSPVGIPLQLATLEDKARRLASRLSSLVVGGPHLIALQEVQDESALDALSLELKRSHGLTYKSCLGQWASQRTEQRVAFLYREDSVRPTKWGSFDVKKVATTTATTVPPSSSLLDPSQLLEKNIYLECDVLGVSTLFVNLHLKAQYDAPNAAIRKQEVAVLRTLVDEMMEVGSSSSLCVLGDFNDFDCSVECAKAPPMHSGVLDMVRSSWGGLATAAEHVHPVSSRSSTVYGDLIDHILVDQHLSIERAEIHPVPGDTAEMSTQDRTSDHFPLIAWLGNK